MINLLVPLLPSETPTLASKVWLWEQDVWVSDLSVRNESIDAWMDGKCLLFVCWQLRMFACVHICIYASRDEWFWMLDMCVCVCAYVSTCVYIIYTDDIHASLHLYGCLICTIHLLICLSTYEYPVHSVFNALIHMDACLGASGLNLTKRIQRNNTDPTIARRGLQNACQSGTEAQRIKNQARHVQEGLGNQRKTHWWQRNETSRLWLMQIESEWRLCGCSREFPNAINASSCRLSGLNSRYVVMWLNKPGLMRLGTPSSFMSTHTHTHSAMQLERLYGSQQGEASERQGVKWVKGFTLLSNLGGARVFVQIERRIINVRSTHQIILCWAATFKPTISSQIYIIENSNRWRITAWKVLRESTPTFHFPRPCLSLALRRKWDHHGATESVTHVV